MSIDHRSADEHKLAELFCTNGRSEYELTSVIASLANTWGGTIEVLLVRAAVSELEFEVI